MAKVGGNGSDRRDGVGGSKGGGKSVYGLDGGWQQEDQYWGGDQYQWNGGSIGGLQLCSVEKIATKNQFEALEQDDDLSLRHI